MEAVLEQLDVPGVSQLTLVEAQEPAFRPPSWPELDRSAWNPAEPTDLLDTFWHFAAVRQQAYMRRLRQDAPPWSEDPILRAYRFTNVYRAADRVSQYLIRHVIYAGSQEPDEVVFRILLFKLFNRIDTWETVVDELGWPLASGFSPTRVHRVLAGIRQAHKPIYSAAYIMPPPQGFGFSEKHRNHLALLSFMLEDRIADRMVGASTLREVFDIFRSYPSIGDFLAFQYAIDVNYSQVTDFSEADFVVAGPGSRDGISKCFKDKGGLTAEELIATVVDRQEEEFTSRGLQFDGLFGRRLQLIDVQNLFCEVSKYTRASHPTVRGIAGRSRIKQSFKPSGAVPTPWFPPDWNLATPVAQELQR